MPVVTWKSNCVFASRYFQESSATQDYIRQFGPLVVAGDRLHRRPPQLMLQVVVVILSTRLIRVWVLDLFACFSDWLFSLISKSHGTCWEHCITQPWFHQRWCYFLFRLCSHIVQTYEFISPFSVKNILFSYILSVLFASSLAWIPTSV